MINEFRGELLYNQETDKHFPHLTVQQTLDFAAKCRTCRARPDGVSQEDSSRFVRDLVISIFGLSAARHTKVGSDLIRGVSGGERKRVSIAEMAIAGAPIGCWDNPTRGLDSGSALAFTQSLRNSSDLCRATHAVAIYQASENIYEVFDKVTLLYEGQQIYFGLASRARSFFLEMGWECPARQTTSDFLTSLTNPTERRARPGYENKVPRTAMEFAARWRASQDHEIVQHGLRQYEIEFPPGDNTTKERFREIRNADRARINAKDSPYTISLGKQIQLCTIRAFQRTLGDQAATTSVIAGQFIMALIMGSLFYMQPDGTHGFFTRGGVLFFTITINALLSLNEINGLYAQRPIVEKHASYAFCTPMAEAIASVVADLPVKFLANVAFNLVLYFMAGLRKTAASFFIFFLFNFVATLSMSLIFRTVAQATRTVTQAMVIAGVLIMALIIYSGFTPTVPTMHPWFSWVRYISPVAYAYEALVVNEFKNRNFPCSDVVPNYPGFQYNQTDKPYFSCSVPGSVAGQLFVSGDAFIESSFQYFPSHLWRNLGILLGMIVFLCFLLMAVTQFVSTATPPAEVLIFRRNNRDALQKYEREDVGAWETDVPNATETIDVGTQRDVFLWKDVTYDVVVKKEAKRLLDGSAGWVKPGSLTALMGVSGAGKTTLLDTLALRTRTGTVSGQIRLGDESVRESESYQQRMGYVQQQDILTETATVREALRFSALLRQPRTISQEHKFEYVESIIRMLDMENFADAVTGQPGLGLNVKQRKLLSIGVELAAKPALLFLDEPTSGLDSQSSWAVVSVLRRLADHGQSILCTVHQPSSTLFEQFDRLLFLAEGGRTAYFGPIGTNFSELVSYFETKGARKCGEHENPAEYIIEVANRASGNQDWPELWKHDARSQQITEEVEQLFGQSQDQERTPDATVSYNTTFAMPFLFQLKQVTFRVFQQYWRTPDYVVSKAALGIFASL
jgi:ATP-binding cassette subfamily G (WHITE) protein 2 (PDR)